MRAPTAVRAEAAGIISIGRVQSLEERRLVVVDADLLSTCARFVFNRSVVERTRRGWRVLTGLAGAVVLHAADRTPEGRDACLAFAIARDEQIAAEAQANEGGAAVETAEERP